MVVLPPNFSRDRSGIWKNVNFRHLSRRIPETVKARVQLTTNRNMYMRFRLVPKSLTLNDSCTYASDYS